MGGARIKLPRQKLSGRIVDGRSFGQTVRLPYSFHNVYLVEFTQGYLGEAINKYMPTKKTSRDPFSYLACDKY